MRKVLAVLLLTVVVLPTGCWWQASKPTKETVTTGTGASTGSVNDTGPSGKGKGRTQDTLPDR